MAAGEAESALDGLGSGGGARGLPVRGQQRRQVDDPHSPRQARQHVGEVRDRVDVGELAAAEQREAEVADYPLLGKRLVRIGSDFQIYPRDAAVG